MSEWYPDDDELLAMTEDAASGVEYIPTGQAPYYLQFRRMLYRILANLAPLGLRVYQTGDLAVRVKPGYCWLGGELKSFPGSAADVTLDNNQTSYVYLDADNAVGVAAQAAGWPAGEHVKLAVVTTAGGSFSPGDIVDLRGASMLGATAPGYRDSAGTIHLAPAGDGGLVLLDGGDPVGIGGVDLNARRAIASYTASGDYSFCAGGECEASDEYAVALGSDCHATGFAAVALGDHCIADDDSAVAMGKGPWALAKGAVAIGLDSYAHLVGQFAHSAGAGTFTHMPQFTRTILNGMTTDANWTELISPGRFVLDWREAEAYPSAVFAVRVTAVGRTQAAGEAVFMIRQALIEKVGATVAMIGAVQTIGTDIVPEALAGSDLQLTGDDTNKSLKVEVKGAASKAILWGVFIESCEVAFPA